MSFEAARVFKEIGSAAGLARVEAARAMAVVAMLKACMIARKT